MRDEHHVVAADRRAQQRRLRLAQTQTEPRQQARVVMEEAVAAAFDVARRIGDDEAVAILQHIAW